MKKWICFKGVPVNPGDVIKITPAKWLNNPRVIEMAVIDSLNTEESALLVLLDHTNAIYNKSPMMELKESEVDCIQVVMEAAEAVPLHSGQIQFRPAERIIFRKGESGSGGKVIAAFNGYIAAELNLGNIEAADVVHFDRPPTPAVAASSEDEVLMYKNIG